MGREFEFIMSVSENLTAGKWIAVVNKDIIEGESAKEVVQQARVKHPNKEPFIMKVPNNSVMLL